MTTLPRPTTAAQFTRLRLAIWRELEWIDVRVERIRTMLLRAQAIAEEECGVTACRAAVQADLIAGRDFAAGCTARGRPCDWAGVPCVVPSTLATERP